MNDRIGRRQFVKYLMASGSFLLASISGIKIDKKEGFVIGKNKYSMRSSEAYGTCGSSYDCAGGGGECGSSYSCTGDGGSDGQGECGSSYSCSGGGGECGSSYDCTGG